MLDIHDKPKILITVASMGHNEYHSFTLSDPGYYSFPKGTSKLIKNSEVKLFRIKKKIDILVLISVP